MSAGPKTWQAVQAEVLRRIRSGAWKPGEPIPHEADLAEELGCARTTVNRALREVAESGLIERRRRAGSRVAARPVRKATLEIPVIRDEVEAAGLAYRFDLLTREEVLPPEAIAAKMAVPGDQRLLHITGLHMAADRPYAHEDRWIDLRAVPAAAEVDFSRISPNEWLVLSIPFEGGDIAFSAAPAGGLGAVMGCPESAALFVVERVTWKGACRLTCVRLSFTPGHRLVTMI